MKNLDGVLFQLQIGLAVGIVLFAHLLEGFPFPIFICYLLSLSLLMNSYRLSNTYKNKNSVDNLLSRDSDQLIVSHRKEVPFINKSKTESVEISRISQVTITQDMLSVILDENGQGFDFYLQGGTQEIFSRLHALLSESELNNIEVNCLS